MKENRKYDEELKYSNCWTSNIGSYSYRYLENKKIISEKNNCVPNAIYFAKQKEEKRFCINKKKWLNNYLDATKKK